jgi:hypothetical protein
MRKGMMILVYVDDCIIMGKDMDDIDQFVLSMQNGPDNVVLMDEGSINKFLGIKIKRLGFKEFKIFQPFLIDCIVSFLGIKPQEYKVHCNSKFTPAAAQVLNKDLHGKPKRKSWKYRMAIGMMSYLQGHTRLDISMPVYQTVRFLNDPKLVHEQAITQIGQYLLGTKEKGIKHKIDQSKGLECYVNANFAGGWDNTDPDNASNLMSRTGFVIKYADCPIYWKSKLQMEIVLSTSKAEYIALSTALREVIPLLTVMEEINEVFSLMMNPLNFYCKVWEDNQSCIVMATSQKLSMPWMKHITLKYHHFKQYVESGKIQINYMHTEVQQANIMTKLVKIEMFPKLCYMLMGW